MEQVTKFLNKVLRKYAQRRGPLPSPPSSLIGIETDVEDPRLLIAHVKLHVEDAPDMTLFWGIVDELCTGHSYIDTLDWTPAGIMIGVCLKRRRLATLLVLQYVDEELIALHNHGPDCEVCRRKRMNGGLEASLGHDAELKGLFLDLLLVSKGLLVARDEIHSWTNLQQQEVYNYAFAQVDAEAQGISPATEEGACPEVIRRYVQKGSG